MVVQFDYLNTERRMTESTSRNVRLAVCVCEREREREKEICWFLVINDESNS